MPGDNTAEGSEEEPGNVTGGVEDLDEVNEGENKDVKVEPDKDAGKEEGDGNEEKTNDVHMKAGNSDDVNEGVYEVDGKEEKADVKVEESSDASEQQSSDWIGQEDNSDGGNAVDHSGFAASEEKNTHLGNEETNVANRNEKQGDANANGEKNEDAKAGEQGNVAASEKEGRGDGKDKGSRGGIEEKEDTRDVGNKRGILLVDRIQCPVEDVERGRSVAAELMESFTRVFTDSVSNSFYPVPQEAIGVGSAFEGWSPRERDVVYRMLVPLNPPPGHAFHLELNSAGQMAARTFCVRVELVCTCEREQLGEKLLCFLHHSQKELRRKQKPSLLETLCTGSYLDVEKTSHWFYQLVRCSWLHLPQSYSWHLVFQPCSRSCQFRLSKGKESLMVEMLFGVRHGDSDIFVVSQPTEAQKGGSSSSVSSRPAKAKSIASTAWPETYAVAEAKFFQHVARQVPCESLHLKCLQLFTYILRGTGFSSSTWKTVVMHVLTTVPLSKWRRREFERRLWDIMAYLRRCLQLKRLEHFVLGNKRLPAEISLPPAMRTVEPLNLFEHLARDPAAHAEAMQAYGQLRFRLWTLLSSH
ncbi:inositol 1,4,5-trisphosphate receptor-interacting protein-like 1 [Aphelocoma coerulescens]|uniref:inositol 1,4,5-trisphosphate receptor-interacting protein-like 1 n=1 Tax=Aphelocoma coerulescens TaxID=39617 RepID=UPI0036050D41